MGGIGEEPPAPAIHDEIKLFQHRLSDQHVVKNPFVGGWRLTFQVKPKTRPIELRAFLDQGGEALTETWSYVILP